MLLWWRDERGGQVVDEYDEWYPEFWADAEDDYPHYMEEEH